MIIWALSPFYGVNRPEKKPGSEIVFALKNKQKKKAKHVKQAAHMHSPVYAPVNQWHHQFPGNKNPLQ